MGPFAERLFQLLFKYKPFVFSQGQLGLGASWSIGLLVLLLAVGGAIAMRRYGTVRGRTTPGDRRVLTLLRAAILLLLLLCLMQPVLRVETAVPQQNFVGVLLDDSRSMRIADVTDGERRHLVTRLVAPESPLRQRLEDRFKLRFFGFAGTVSRASGAEVLDFAGARTDLAAALRAARQELSSVPLSALVLITDGADNAGAPISDEIASLTAAGLPVYTIGVGAEEFSRDLEIVRVDAPRTALRGSTVGAEIVIRQRGYDGERVRLLVEDEGRVLATRDIELPRAGETVTVPSSFPAEEPGARVVSFAISPLEGEMMRQNNRVTALVNVRDDAPRILYLEGAPRPEVKFIRRALERDDNLRLALLERTAENRYYRLFESDARFGGDNELYGGFPRTREELFAYSGILLGNVEAGFFTDDQLRMIADFVSQRGGGLMVLGGHNALLAGGFAGTPVAEVLPVVLEGATLPDGRAVEAVRARVAPTLYGRSHPAMQLDPDPETSLERWRTLPPLVLIEPLTRAKPGAVTLLEGTDPILPEPVIVLASQRYGAGKVIAFPVVDSWQWQMHHDIPVEDLTHETFWQQVLRWLVADVRGQVRVRLGADRFEIGEPVEVVAEVSDETFLAINGARVTATVTAPEGEVSRLDLPWSVDVDGRYVGAFTPREEGFYAVEISAERGDLEIGSDRTVGQATELTAEFFAAEMNRGLLQRIAEETGGRFYSAAGAGALGEDIAFTQSGTTVVEILELWDMPVVFLLLLLLIGAEWAWRKRKRLA